MRRRIATRLAAVTGALLLAAASGAQPVAPGAAETVDVRVVDVEVQVTDARGHQVQGIGRDELQLLVDGRAVPIEFFAEFRDGAVTVDGRPPASAADSGRSFLVYVDDSLAVGAYRDRVLTGVES